MATARHRNVCQAPVNEFFSRALSVHMDEHAVGGLALTAVTRDCVAVVEMRIVSDVERESAA
jgi:hypothetical protein